ncbi:MAG TPA: hypothetical protein ENK41_02115 [Rhodobacteraceae bacterium]|nr:hypothetical protein [Paracoccaceae bacterium]
MLPPSAETFRHGGIPVSARELDSLYAGFDGLADAAAVPVDDPVMGKRICAAIVPNPGLSISFEDFRNYLLQRRVASFKFPDRLITVSEIPRRADGGIMRDKILEQL